MVEFEDAGGWNEDVVMVGIAIGRVACNPDLEALRNSESMATKPRMCQDNHGEGP